MSKATTTHNESQTDRITAVSPAPHEFGANLVFTSDELQPYFAFDSAVKEAGGGATGTISYDGQRYDVGLSYQQSGLKPWDNERFRLESVREFRISFEATDELGERSGSFLIQPRWPNMQSKGDRPNPSCPDIIGVNLKVQGSNLPLEDYLPIFRRAVESFDINSKYFADSKVHEYSNIFSFEYYIRLDREKSKSLVGQNGILRRMFEHVEAGDGQRELKEDNRQTLGYYNHVKIDSDGAGKLVSGHRYGKQIKAYHPKHVRDNPSDALYHPKVGVSLQTNYNADGSVSWDSRDELVTECDELLLNVLAWGGLSTRVNSDTYVSDEYFEATETERDIRLVENPLPDIKRKQDAVVVDGLTANPNLNESDTEAVEIIADGGQMTVDELADESDYSKRTIYRVIERLEDILQRDSGRIGFVSNYIADVVRTTLSDAKDALSKDGGSGSGSSAFQKWANAHGVEVSDSDDGRLLVRFGRVPGDVNDVLRAGLRAWKQSGRNPRRFNFGKARWKTDGRMNYRVPIFQG